MILAEKIAKLRKQQGWSQEELAARLGVSRQSVSKWESMASMPDLDKILKMSELFGVSTDYLLKDNSPEEAVAPLSAEPVPAQAVPVSLEEANTYLTLAEQCHQKIALAVSLCIFSPVPLIFLSGAAAQGFFALTEVTSTALGVSALLLIVAVAMVLLIPCGIRLSRYEYLEKDPIATEYGVAGIAETRKEAFAPAYRSGLVCGIFLCIISVIPLLAAMALQRAFFLICSVCLLLILVSIGVHLIIRVQARWESYQKLLEEGDYTPEKKAENKRNAPLIVFYWCFVTALYLGISLYTNLWGRSWIVWPVAGVLFAAVLALKQMFTTDR